MRNNLSFINVYKKQSIKPKLLVTQLLYGDSFKIIEKNGSWIKIKNDFDGYKGFIKKKIFHLIKNILIKYLMYLEIYIHDLM